MRSWLASLFSENSTVSMTRFLSFICVASSTIISFYGVYHGTDVTALVAIYLGAGMGAKVAQKSIELKNQKVIVPVPGDDK